MSETPVPEQAVTDAAGALAVHRWKTMGVSSVECECGAVIAGESIAIGPSFDPDGPGYETARFPADEAFRSHLAAAVLEAAAPALREQGAAALREQGAAAERERIARFIEEDADCGSRPGLVRIALRALAGRVREDAP